MKLLQELHLVSEGKFDTGILKAVFIIGGPNVGKTSYAKYFSANIPMHPKVYDADKLFEFLSQKHNIDISSDETTGSKKLYGEVRPKNVKQLELWVNELLPLIVLLAPDNIERTLHRIKLIEAYGYDIKILVVQAKDHDKIVNTLSQRTRGVDPEYARAALQLTDSLINSLVPLYPTSVIPNVQDTTKKDAAHLAKQLNTFYRYPVTNEKGKALINAIHSTPSYKRITDVDPDALTHVRRWYEKPTKPDQQ
jgi:hypothetical protein